MDPCKMCEGTGTVRAVNPRTGARDDTMPKETCPECGGPEAAKAAQAAMAATAEAGRAEEEPEEEAADEPDEDD